MNPVVMFNAATFVGSALAVAGAAIAYGAGVAMIVAGLLVWISATIAMHFAIAIRKV